MQDAELKISKAPGLYNSDVSQVPYSELPMTSAGIMNTRIQDAPPATQIDIESQLFNKFDVIGKSGLVAPSEVEKLKQARGDSITQSPAVVPSKEVFFQPIHDRTFKSCNDAPSFYRDDPNPVAPLILGIYGAGQRGGESTRMNAKDEYTKCRSGK